MYIKIAKHYGLKMWTAIISYSVLVLPHVWKDIADGINHVKWWNDAQTGP